MSGRHLKEHLPHPTLSRVLTNVWILIKLMWYMTCHEKIAITYENAEIEGLIQRIKVLHEQNQLFIINSKLVFHFTHIQKLVYMPDE